MKKILLLDLEETVIPVFGEFFVPDHWGRFLRNFIANLAPNEVKIYSWAIYNDNDRATFLKAAPLIEQELGTSFSHTYTIEEIMAEVNTFCGIKSLDMHDFFDFYNKERVLFDLSINGWMPDTHITLLDDAVKEASIKTSTNMVDIINFKKALAEF